MRTAVKTKVFIFQADKVVLMKQWHVLLECLVLFSMWGCTRAPIASESVVHLDAAPARVDIVLEMDITGKMSYDGVLVSSPEFVKRLWASAKDPIEAGSNVQVICPEHARLCDVLLIAAYCVELNMKGPMIKTEQTNNVLLRTMTIGVEPRIRCLAGICNHNGHKGGVFPYCPRTAVTANLEVDGASFCWVFLDSQDNPFLPPMGRILVAKNPDADIGNIVAMVLNASDDDLRVGYMIPFSLAQGQDEFDYIAILEVKEAHAGNGQ